MEHHRTPLGGASAPWTLFDAAYGTVPDGAEDPEGLAADRSFRLAVVADALDGSWPLARLVLAGTRERLEAFARSAEFRAIWERGASLDAAFGGWARALVRERPDAAGLGALAFDTWAQALASGRGAGTFPVDLGEALFAARALRKHLATRGWATGVVESSGLEGLAQVVARAPTGAWSVRAVWEEGRLGVRPQAERNLEAGRESGDAR